MTSFITFENREVWQGLFNEVAKEKPAVGRLVRITRGKHSGKIGVVKCHQLSRFKDPFRYGNSASHAMTQARGRYGFCILVENENENENFWTNAEYTIVCIDS